MEISVTKKEDLVIIAPEGDVDLYSSPEVRKELVKHIKKKVGAIAVDLSRVSYMDSSGIATLVEGLQLTGEYGAKFKLMCLGPMVREVFELARLEKVFQIYDDEESLMASLAKS